MKGTPRQWLAATALGWWLALALLAVGCEAETPAAAELANTIRAAALIALLIGAWAAYWLHSRGYLPETTDED
ncbi:MAG: hypothetical protein HUK20_13140 [Fibrobacter sp.]|nr:hypothetical protein [Fibrobacter sp.]